MGENFRNLVHNLQFIFYYGVFFIYNLYYNKWTALLISNHLLEIYTGMHIGNMFFLSNKYFIGLTCNRLYDVENKVRLLLLEKTWSHLTWPLSAYLLWEVGLVIASVWGRPVFSMITEATIPLWHLSGHNGNACNADYHEFIWFPYQHRPASH